MSKTVSKPMRDALESYARLDARQRAIFAKLVGRSYSEPIFEAHRPIARAPTPGPWLIAAPSPAPEET